MFKVIALWLFVMAFLADLVIVGLKCFDVIDWSWMTIISIPFLVSIAGTIAFSIFYAIIKIFVSIVLRF